MTAIATLSGRVIDFLAPVPDQVRLDDLAAGLSRQPRYSGQTRRTYTVAQHSLLVAHLAPPEFRLEALLHDAPEAYLCDLPSPAKEAMRVLAGARGDKESDYDKLEALLLRSIGVRFCASMDPLPEEVRDADHMAMVIEAPRLQPAGWALSIWDFARAHIFKVFPTDRDELDRVLELDQGGRYAWMLAVVEELTFRRTEVETC